MSEISVIIPVYNASEYLSRCLDSILRQTFTEWQLILVDDGSRDDSLHIMQKYAEKDSRVKVFHKANEGVSIARQYGLDRVDTPYFIFCDADDYVEPDYLEKLYEAIKKNNSDIAVCKYVEEYEHNNVLSELPITNYDGFIHNMLRLKIWGVTWNKLYKIDIVKQCNIRFIPKLQMWEDFAFTLDYCLRGKSVSFVPEVLYHYNQRNLGSITKHEDLLKNHDRVAAIKFVENVMISLSKDERYNLDMLWLKFHIKDAFALFGYPGKQRLNLWLTTFPEANTLYGMINERKLLHKCLCKGSLSALFIRWYYVMFMRKVRRIIKGI